MHFTFRCVQAYRALFKWDVLFEGTRELLHASWAGFVLGFWQCLLFVFEPLAIFALYTRSRALLFVSLGIRRAVSMGCPI